MVQCAAYVDTVITMNSIIDGRLTTRITRLLEMERILRSRTWLKDLPKMAEVINSLQIPITDTQRSRAKEESLQDRRETPKEGKVRAKERTEKREEISSPRSRWRKRLAREELSVPAF